MAKEEILGALDIGSSKVSCIICRSDPENIEIIGSGNVPCSGLKNGVVANMDETIKAISSAVEQAELQASTALRSLYVGIKGSHIMGYNHQGAISISRADKEINPEDIEKVIESAKAIPLSPERSIIHTIPQEFIVDGQKGIPYPVGMEGTHLGVYVHIVTVVTTSMNNLIKCINKAGFEVNEVILGILAVSDAVLINEEKDLGCLLIDIGGQTVDIAVFTENSLRMIKELPVGGDHITRDLAYVLRTSISEAKRLKEEFGQLPSKNIEGEVTVSSVDGKNQNSISLSRVSEIIEARTEEIFSMVREEIINLGYEDMTPAGIILSGGSSLLKGIDSIARKVFQLPVRIGVPQNIKGDVLVSGSPVYSTAIGLINYAHRNSFPRHQIVTARSRRTSIFRKMKEIFNELL